MAVILEPILKKDISTGDFAPGYILFGDDAYLKKLYMDRIADKTAGLDSAFDYQTFNCDCDLQEVYDAVLQYPMMSEKKCVTLTDYDFEKAGKSDFDKLCDILINLNDSCVFVLRFDSINFDIKQSKAKKLITAIEKSGGKAVKLGYRSIPELAKMLSDGALKRGCKMESGVANYLIENVGTDISTLKNELDKLCHFVGGGNIEKSTVDKVCVKTVESSIYDLTTKIFACDPASALKLLDDFFFMRIDPIIILYTISSAFIDMYRLSAAKKGNVSNTEISEVFGTYKSKQFLLNKASANLSKFDGKKLDLSFDALLEADRKIKSFGGNERAVLEELVVKLCFILAKGKSV